MYEVELYHHGIKGQKWGLRRFQNKDGSYKPGAEGRYDGDGKISRAIKGAKSGLSVRKKNRALSSENKKLAAQNKKLAVQNKKLTDKSEKEKEGKKFELSERQKKALKVGAVACASVLAAYGAKKLYDHVDATHKGKLLAKKLLDEAGGDFEKASEAYSKRLNQFYWDKNTGALGKYAEKSGKIMESTQKSIADAYRKQTFENSQISKDLRAIKDASRAQRKEQFDRVTKGIREAGKEVGSKAKSGADAARTRAGEAAKNARSAYERNAGKRMANSINRSYARKQAMNKAKSAVNNAASKMRNSKLGRAADNVRATYTGQQSQSERDLRDAFIRYRRKHNR